jgi:hypothetical protein
MNLSVAAKYLSVAAKCMLRVLLHHVFDLMYVFDLSEFDHMHAWSTD